MATKRIDPKERFSRTKNKFTELSSVSEKIKKEATKTFVVNIDKNVAKEYREFAFDYFKNKGQLAGYSISSFFEEMVNLVYQNYLETYGDLIELTADDKKFFSKRGRSDHDTIVLYNHKDIAPIVFKLKEETIDKFSLLMNTHYRRKLSNLRSYGNTFYFYDLFEQAKKLITKK